MLDETQRTFKPNYTVIIVVGLIFLYFMIKDELAKSSQLNNENKIIDDPNYNLASQLRSAFHISLISSVIETHDEKKIFEIAEKITDWQGVQKAYYALYSETLISRLQDVFQDSPNKLNLFYSKVAGANNNNPTIPKAGKIVVGSTVSAVRKTYGLDITDSRIVLKTYATGDTVGKYLGDFSTAIKGVTYAIVEISWYIFLKKRVIIAKYDLITY